MANPEHVEKIQEGVKAWNEWRDENPNLAGDLSGADIHDLDLVGANFRQSNLIEANLCRAYVSGANLRQAVLRAANLIRADLRQADLSSADLRQANLSRADISRADLAGAYLETANLRWSDLSRSTLVGANLVMADLGEANLVGANLATADLRQSTLIGANLTAANLAMADLSDSTVFLSVFAAVDLSAVTGLEAVRHAGPCTIGIDTIYRSRGTIPESFLRGCGVPEPFFEFVHRLLAASPNEFYSCFISYSTNDQEFADRLQKDLRAKGVHCWFAPHDVRGGRKLHEQIDEAIRSYDRLLVVLSEHSMNSEWVKDRDRTCPTEGVGRKAPSAFPRELGAICRDPKMEVF